MDDCLPVREIHKYTHPAKRHPFKVTVTFYDIFANISGVIALELVDRKMNQGVDCAQCALHQAVLGQLPRKVGERFPRDIWVRTSKARQISRARREGEGEDLLVRFNMLVMFSPPALA